MEATAARSKWHCSADGNRRPENFGALIRQLRAEAGLSQTELARRVGTTQSAVARLEAQSVAPRLETVERLATALGTSLRLDVSPEPPTSGIYLDANATTPLDARAAAAMLDAYQLPTNAGSSHWAGDRSRDLLATARDQVAALVRAESPEIVFTSGATESNALAAFGVTGAAPVVRPRNRLVVPVTEHPAMLRPLEALAAQGWDLVRIGVDGDGRPLMSALLDAVDERTLLVSVMAANNETGTQSALEEIAAICHAHGALLHSDATQLAAWGSIDVQALGVDLLSISAHKMHGPLGIGALYVSREVLRDNRIRGITVGGGQERGLRGGTVNVPAAVGFGVAAALAVSEGRPAASVTESRRDLLEDLLRAGAPELQLNGSRNHRLPGTLNVSFGDVSADAIMAGAPDVAISTGSACASGTPGPSHVLKAMGVSDERAESSLRFSLTRHTTEAEIRVAAQLILESTHRIHRIEEAVA